MRRSRVGWLCAACWQCRQLQGRLEADGRFLTAEQRRELAVEIEELSAKIATAESDLKAGGPGAQGPGPGPRVRGLAKKFHWDC